MHMLRGAALYKACNRVLPVMYTMHEVCIYTCMKVGNTSVKIGPDSLAKIAVHSCDPNYAAVLAIVSSEVNRIAKTWQGCGWSQNA